MIRKSGLVLLSALAFELLESLFLGYGYYIIVAAVLFFVVSSEVLIYNVSYSRDLWSSTSPGPCRAGSGRTGAAA